MMIYELMHAVILKRQKGHLINLWINPVSVLKKLFFRLGFWMEVKVFH